MPNYLAGLDPLASVGWDDELGADRRYRGGGYSPQGGRNYQQYNANTDVAMARANRVAALVRPDVAGVPARDAALLPAGFPVFSFALATGINGVTQQLNIQTPFRGQRLVAQVIRNGTSAALTAPVIQVFQVGMKPILTTANPVPLEIFTQTAYDTNMLLPPTQPGVIYSMTIALTLALTTTDTITCLVGIMGSAVL